MSNVSPKAATVVASFRQIQAPYRTKMERAQAAWVRLQDRHRKAFEAWEEEMRELFGSVPDVPTPEAQ